MPRSRRARPPQKQSRQPGREYRMVPRPKVVLPSYRACRKLAGKVGLITGGDSGIGRAVAVLFAKEVFLASSESTYITGQILHPNGGEVING